MRKERLVVPRKDPRAFRIKLVVLSLFFVLGCIAGRVAHRATAGVNNQQLRDYILQYANFSAQQEDLTVSILSVFGVYFRYPFALFLFGLSVIGILLIPILLLVQGFSITFSVAGFVSALGRNGLTLSSIVFGLRYCVVLPLTLFLALYAWDASINQWGARGKQRDFPRFSPNADFYLRFAVCFVILALGSIIEWLFMPRLLKMIISHMM